MTSAAAIASRTPGRGLGLLGADRHHRVRVQGGAQLHPVLLEVDRLAFAVHLDGDMRLDAVVGHRDETDAGLPAGTQGLGDGAERVARAEHLRTDDVGREVAVAEPEPLGPHPVGGQLLLDGEGLLRTPPPLLLVDAAAQRVHHRVEVGADLQAEQMDVVARVADDGDIGLGGGRLETTEEAGTTDAACQNHNAHTQSLSGGYDILGCRGGPGGVHRHVGQARVVHVQAHRRLQGVVDDLVDVARSEHSLGSGRKGPRAAFGVLGQRAVQDGQYARRRAVVVDAAALAGHPGQEPDLIAGPGAQAVVPAGGRVVLDQGGPLGGVGGEGTGESGELGDRGGVLAGGLEEVLDLQDVTGDLEVAVAAVHGAGVPRRECWGVADERGVSRRGDGGRPQWTRGVLGEARGEAGSHGKQAVRDQQLEQQQRAWTALRNPRTWVARCAVVTDMRSRRAGRWGRCQPNDRFGRNVSPYPVAVAGERFVQSGGGRCGAAGVHSNTATFS